MQESELTQGYRRAAKKSFQKNNFIVNNYFSTPTPFNNFLWYIVAMDTAGANIGYYSVFDKTNDIALADEDFGKHL